MHFAKLAAIGTAILLLAGCAGQTPTERALAGGLAGAIVADATDNNIATTAAVGALAGLASCGVPGMPPCR